MDSTTTTTTTITREFDYRFPFFNYTKTKVTTCDVSYSTVVLRLLQRGLLQSALKATQKMGEEERRVFTTEEVLPRIRDSADLECMAWYMCTEKEGLGAVQPSTQDLKVEVPDVDVQHDQFTGLFRLPQRDRVEVDPSEMCRDVLQLASEETLVTFLENVQKEYCQELTLRAYGLASAGNPPERAGMIWEKTLQRCPLDNVTAVLIYYHYRGNLRSGIAQSSTPSPEADVIEFLEKRAQ